MPAGNLTLYSDANETVILRDQGLAGDLVAGDGIYSLLWQPQRTGTYRLNYGSDTVTVTVTSATPPPPTYRAIEVPFAYENISGSSLSATDESVRYVATNGTVSFTTSSNPGYINQSLPTTAATTLVAPFWDDLTPSGANSNVFVACS